MIEGDDRKLIKHLSIWGAVFAILFGSLLHFLYDFSNDNFIVGLFAPVNESVWEHLKLVFTPLALFATIDYRYLSSKVNNYLFALMKEIFFGIGFIIVIFYTYTFFSHESILAIDILTFVFAIIIAKWFGYLIQIGKFKKWEFRYINIISVTLIIGLVVFFIYATINPPQNGLFVDPITNTYGIYQK